MKTALIALTLIGLTGIGMSLDPPKGQSTAPITLTQKAKADLNTKSFSYSKVSGIGYEKGVTRRDPSDVIRVGNKYYVYYTYTTIHYGGYWGGSIYCAESTDEGHTWKEVGKVLDTGKKGAFDSFSVFTPNIIFANGKYYLYYTGVCPTPGTKNLFKNNSTTDITALGVAVSDQPTGPFQRITSEPILRISNRPNDFDSYRIDDTAMLYQDGKYFLYYKGRSRKDGGNGPAHTQMGVAIATNPAGPFVKQGTPILPRSHEVMIWKGEAGGVFALASITSTLEFSSNGLDFTTNRLSMKKKNRPNAPGAYRLDLTDPSAHEGLTWGISMVHHPKNPYLVRFEFKK